MGKSSHGRVLVLILSGFETKQCDNNIKYLKDAFSDPYFITKVISFNCTKLPPQNSNLTLSQYKELQTMKKALDFSSHSDENWSNLPVIIIKDSSITNVDPQGMKERIAFARKYSSTDLLFLTVWADACTKQKLIANYVDGGSNLNWTYQPTATQAIMYTPASKSTVKELILNSTISYSATLNNAIAAGKLTAATFTPNIIDFDIALSTSNSDYYKLNTCANIVTQPDTGNGLSSLLFFIVLVAIIIFTAYCLLILGPSSSC